MCRMLSQSILTLILPARTSAFLLLVNHKMFATAVASRRWLGDRSRPAAKNIVQPTGLVELMLYHRFVALVAPGLES